MRGRCNTLCLRIPKPLFPSVCIVVLTVSTGVRIIRKAAAAKLAKTVFTSAGSFFMKLFDSRRASMPALAAVSPNRETGP